MSITKILSEKEVSSADKLERVAQVVAGAREAYGNTDVEIASTVCNTTHGAMNFIHLEDDSKVEALRGEVQRIKSQAIEYVEQNAGTSLNRKIEEILSTNGMFCNIAAGTKFEYI